MEKIRVLVVDDHLLVRDGIVWMLSSFPDMEIVGEASSGEEAIRLTEQLQPDVILMDLLLPGINGIEAARTIKEKQEESKILFLSMEVSQDFLSDVIKMGANGYVLKEIRRNELAVAIRKVLSGEQYFSKGISDMVFQQYLEGNNKGSEIGFSEMPPVKLTDREIEVVKFLCSGCSKKEIADQLFISPRTVDAHRSNILEKLQLSGTVELVIYAVKNKIIKL